VSTLLNYEVGAQGEGTRRFGISTQVLNVLQGVAEHTRGLGKTEIPQKSDRNLGSRRDAWCEFHKGFGHDVERCIALGYQLAGLVKDGFLKEYLEGD